MIMKTKLTPLFCSLVLASALTAFAAPEKVSLWPEGKIPDFQEKQIAAPTDVAGKPDFKPEEWRMPYLEWSEPPAESNRNDCCLILISGGSYINWCDVGLVEGWRRRFTAEGFQCVKLVYRTPRPEGLEIYRTAWQDGQRAIRLVRSQAEARGLDPDRIGIMGSSAGGHLTLMGAASSQSPAYEPIDELDKLSCKVHWGIAIYPAYGLTDGVDCGNSTGGNADSAVLVPEFVFDEDTPPMLFVHGDADGWAAMNSVKAWEQLRRMGIQSDLHTLVRRGHCFQFKAAPGTGSYTWLGRIWEFMNHMGFNK